ncbi:MAG: phage portal protein [Ruminococcus sp.]|nr:phage portal protein [Ruminococcus sp.]
MSIFRRKSKPKDEVVQCAPRRVCSHPFGFIDSYSPLTETELELYSVLREAVPIIDAAIGKIIRLMGTFTVECENRKTRMMIDEFFRDVNVCQGNRGINTFITTYFDQLLTYGQAVGEIVLTPDGNNIAALYNANPKDIKLCAGETPLDIIVCKNGVDVSPLPYQDLLVSTLLNPQPGRVRGTSLLYGLPFVSKILLKIYNSIGQNWERAGNIHFAVTYKPDKESGFANARENAEQIASQWSRVMSEPGGNCDFVSVGDISIQTIGADNPIMDCDVPIRRVSEQIVAKLGIPPFLLGLSWSTTERMSSQQADILTSELEYYRETLNPIIRRIVRMFLNIKGIDEKVDVYWNNINLQDELERSQARLNNANALRAEKEIEREFGVIESEEGIIENI